MTPLHSVAMGGDVGTAQILIDKGADINIKDNNGVREWVCITDSISSWLEDMISTILMS